VIRLLPYYGMGAANGVNGIATLVRAIPKMKRAAKKPPVLTSAAVHPRLQTPLD
jgi:hypothetical protein